jgi:cytohesin
VNQKNTFGTTPLHLAAANGHVGCLGELLKAGAQANALESDGSTPLLAASREGHVDVVQALLAWKGLKTKFPAVNPPTNPNKADLYGSAPLHVAAARGNVDIVVLLLGDPRTDKNQRTLNRLETPLFVAARAGQAHAVQRLAGRTNGGGGADLTLANREGWTPLHVAAYEGHVDAMSALITLGAPFDQAAVDGSTPLHLAAGNGQLGAVEKLVQVAQPGTGAHSDLDARDALGRPPVAMFCSS